MNSLLKNKVNDFSKWAENSFEHFYNDRFADALTNMRKSGESAIKLIITNEYFGIRGEKKTAQKGYKELINLLITENIVPRKVINWLETIQIYGNIATHDNKVVFSQAEYGRVALQMLIIWLFDEYLSTEIPVRLSNFIDQQWDTKKLKEQLCLLQDDLDNSRKKTQKLEQELKNSISENQKNDEKALILNNKLKEEKTIIAKELEISRQILSQLQEKLHIASKETEQLKTELKEVKQKEIVSDPEPEKPLKISKKKKIGIGIGIILLISIFSLIFFNPFNQKTQEDNKVGKKEDIIIPEKEENPFIVLILPFSVLQDNPNIVVKLEDAILRRLVQKSEDNNLSMQVIYNPEKDKAVISYKQALETGKKQNANIIIFGEVYEQASGDSVQAIVKYILTGDTTQQVSGETKMQSFSKLTDIQAGDLKAEIECIIDMAIAFKLINKGNNSDALVILNEIDTVYGEYYRANLSYLKAECYYTLGKYTLARDELQKSFKYYPDDHYNLNFMGRILLLLEQYDEAEKSFQKAIELDTNNVNYLLNYADLLAYEYFNNYEKAKALVLTALQKDSTNSKTYFYLAELEVIFKNYKEAEKKYLKAIALDSCFTAPKINYAIMLAFNLDQPEKAVSYLYEAIKKDSTNYFPYYKLGDIFLNTKIKNIKKAKYYFLKSKKLQAFQDANIYFGLGAVYHEEKDYKKAETYYLKALELNSGNLSIYKKTIELYGDLNKMEKVKFYLDKAYSLDSTDIHIINNLGIFYGAYVNTKYYNIDKSIKYFRKAMEYNPNDITALPNIGYLYYLREQYTLAKDAFLRLVKLYPDNYDANYFLGIIYEKEADHKQARKYIEKALSINPNEPELYAKLSEILFQAPFYNTESALNYAQKAVDMGSQNSELYYKVAQIFFAAGKINKAKEIYNKAIELNPKLKSEEFEKLLYNK
ncbi:MAG: tetratricopeptide repeat protein [Bacteroidota bacterium]